MSAKEIFVGDVGTAFTLTVVEGTSVVDISSASVKEILFQKPSGTVVTKTATFQTDGTDGKIRYITIAGDIDESGYWLYQGHIVLPSWSGHTDTHGFEVYRVIGT